MPAWIHSDPNADDGHWRDDSLRECARAERCSDPRIETVDGKIRRLPALTPRPLCEPDRTLLFQTINQTPATYVDLYRALPRLNGTGPKVSGSKSPPLPLRADVEALMREMNHITTTWAEIVSAVAGLSADQPKRHGPAIQQACDILTRRLDALLALDTWPVARYFSLKAASELPPGTGGKVFPSAGYAVAIVHLDGAEAAEEIFSLHAKCRSMLGLTRKRETLNIPCEHCGRAAITRQETAAGVADDGRCGHCGQTYTPAEWSALQAVVHQEQVAAGALIGHQGVKPSLSDAGSGRA